MKHDPNFDPDPDAEAAPDPDADLPPEHRAHLVLPDFAPVPRKCERQDGWTPARQKLFIEALADYGSVRAACESVGLATVGAYRLRRQPGAEGFAAAWEAALAHGVRRIEDALMDRALNGVEVPVYSYGKLIGTRTKYNDRLGMFMLRNRAPHRFAAGGGARGLNAIGKMERERLRKELRAEWDAELADEDQENRASIDRMLDTMARNRKSNMSPAQREREIAATAQGLADKAAGWIAGPYREYAEEAAKLLPGFIAEVETDWPPLPSWAWDEPEDAAEAEDGHDAPALPPPAEEEKPAEPEPPSGPRIRTLKDDGW